MGSHTPRTLIALVIGSSLLIAACGGAAAETTTTTTSIPPTTTTTTLAPEAAFIVATEGDDNPVVRALQFLLVCNGYEQTVVDGLDRTLVPDGQYGAITSTVVDRVQRDLGLDRDGSSVNALLYERLASTCENTRSFYLSPTVYSLDAGGYASSELPDSWTFWGQPGQRVTITPHTPPLRMGLYDPNGAEMVPVAETEEITVGIATAGSHTVKVNSDEPLTYTVTLSLPPHYSKLLLQSTGLDLVDFGDSPAQTIATVSVILGEPTADSDWNEAGSGCVRWRRVEWGESELWLYFTDAGTDASDQPTFAGDGIEHFAFWQINLPEDGEGTLPPLATPSGLQVGDSAADTEATYGDRVAIEGTSVSIVDGIIMGALDEADGILKWLRSGATICGDPDAGNDPGS